jgi:phosphomannomutase
VRAVARALARHLLKKPAGKAHAGVAIGYDTRFLSTEFAQAAANEIASQGVPVLLSDRDSATPAIAFTVRNRGLAGGVMITASHNPPRYNGFKFFMPSGCSADKESTSSVESFLSGDMSTHAAADAATVTLFDPIPTSWRNCGARLISIY